MYCSTPSWKVSHKMNTINKVKCVCILIVSSILFLSSSSSFALTTVTISDEASGNTIAGRAAAASLDDAWVASFVDGVTHPDIFAGGTGYSQSTIFADINGFSYQVNWQLGYLNTTGPGTPVSIDFIDVNNGGTVTQGPSNAIQSGAPNPFPTGITRLSPNLSNSGLNAIRFDFGSSPTPIREFGIFVGDTESRLNYGTAARVIVFDTVGNVINDTPIIQTGTVLNGTDYSPVVEPLATIGFPTGPNNNPSNKWGNGTTVFITVKADQPIGQVFIHVGDDDHTSNNNGTSEQLGLVGFQIPNVLPVVTPVPSLSDLGVFLLILLLLLITYRMHRTE